MSGHADATLGLFRDRREERAARERMNASGITGVVFGHTHEKVDGALDGCLYNYGTWLPSLDLGSPHVKAKVDAHGLTLDILKDSTMYRAERTVVRLTPEPPHRTRIELVTADEA